MIFVAAVFLLAGWVKGVVGLGLPTVAMGALGLIMPPVQAAALLVIPSLVTNIWQFATGPAKLPIVRRLTSMMLFVCLGTALGISFLTGPSRWPSAALGAVLVLYALLALYLPRLTVPARLEPPLSPAVGFTTGLLTGATGVFVVPAVPYLSALGFNKDELVQALGLSFTVSTIALAVALGSTNSLSARTLLASLGAVIPALLGMFVGQRTRNRIDPVVFRRWFFTAMLLVGGYMVLRGLAM
ncbi:MAG: sulfite exporter TauE/SafE family protein [Desulfobulbaceae bacterium]|nr:sulfite exporter TauE/SafE family protein [Desulfobulbaceae bacterium]